VGCRRGQTPQGEQGWGHGAPWLNPVRDRTGLELVSLRGDIQAEMCFLPWK